MTITAPTNIPAGDRPRPVRVKLPTRRPTTVPGVFRAAARVLAANGLHQGDYFPDATNREMCIPEVFRPLSIVGALRCAATGSPREYSLLGDEALAVLALRLEVDGAGPEYRDIFSLEDHVDGWGDLPGRTTESAVAVLEAAADGCEVSA